MKNNWKKMETFHKSVILSALYSFIAIVISLLLLLVDTSWIYGSLIGISLLFISYLIIWILWYKIPKIKTPMAKMLPILVPLLRIVIFLIVFICIILLVNTGEGLELMINPINLFSLLITYSISVVSYLSIGIIEIWIK